MLKAGKELEGVEDLEKLIGQDGEYRSLLTVESERYSEWGKVNDCINEMVEVLGKSVDLTNITKVADGNLIPFRDGEWLRLLDEVQGFKGFVLYGNSGNSVRVTLDLGSNNCAVQFQTVGLIRGKEGVESRMGGTKAVAMEKPLRL